MKKIMTSFLTIGAIATFSYMYLEANRTPKKIASYLENIGVEVHTEVGGRGVVGYIRGGKPGKTVAVQVHLEWG